MSDEFGMPEENQGDEWPVDTSTSKKLAYLWPGIALAVIAVVVIGGYFLYQNSVGSTLLAPRPARVAFMSDRDGNWEIYVVDRDGNNLENLTNNPAIDGIPIHSAGRSQLAFVSDRDGSGLDLFVANLEGDGVSNVTQTPDRDEIPIAWSPDGNHLIFAGERGGLTEIFMIQTDGAGLLNLTEREQAQSFDDWSSTSDQFILTTATETSIALLITNLAGDTHVALTDGSYPAGGGRWSPDGQKIAFMAIAPDGNAIDIYVVDVTSGEPVNLTNSTSNDRFPRWSPDGSKIGFVSDRDGNSEVYVMDADGSNVKNLTNDPASEAIQGDFAWSPDGTQILFHTNRDDDVEVYVMDADGSDPVNLTSSPGTDFNAIWVQ